MDYGAYLTKAFPNQTERVLTIPVNLPSRVPTGNSGAESFPFFWRKIGLKTQKKIAKRTTFLLPETLKALQDLTREGLIAEAEGEYRFGKNNGWKNYEQHKDIWSPIPNNRTLWCFFCRNKSSSYWVLSICPDFLSVSHCLRFLPPLLSSIWFPSPQQESASPALAFIPL